MHISPFGFTALREYVDHIVSFVRDHKSVAIKHKSLRVTKMLILRKENRNYSRSAHSALILSPFIAGIIKRYSGACLLIEKIRFANHSSDDLESSKKWIIGTMSFIISDLRV